MKAALQFNDIVLMVGGDGTIIEGNDRAAEAYGYPLRALSGMPIGQLRGDGTIWQNQLAAMLRQGQLRFETLHRRADGTVFPVEVSARRVDRADGPVLQCLIRDITERKQAERQISRLKDTYAALSQTNQCILHAVNRRELFATICRIAIECGHFHLAWIGLADPAGKLIEPVEVEGEGRAYLDGVRLSTDPASPSNRGTAGQAYATGRYCITNDMAASESVRPWLAKATQFGIRSSAAFPLFCGGGVIGVLVLHSDEVGFFTPDLIALLDEMAQDISFALDRLQEGAARELLERDLASSKFELRKLSVAIEQSPVTVIITDRHGTIEYVNPAFTATSGYTADEAIGRSPAILKSGTTSPEEYRAMWDCIQSGRAWSGLFRNRRKDGSFFWEEAVIAPVRDQGGAISQYIGVKQDVTKRREAEESTAFLTYHDGLTKLPNRMLGKDRMERAMINADRLGSKSALLMVNIDHFKRVNDSLGMAAGDALLLALVERIRGCIRETDTLSRQGSDDFLVVLAAVHDPEAINRIAAQILERTVRPFDILGAELSITVSVGIAVYPDDGADFDALLRRANLAMRHAKDAGRNTYRFFGERMNVDASEYLVILNGLRRALDQYEFVLHYQPQIALDSGEIIGAEALIRWNDPARGLVQPGKFISIAEDSGLIVEMGNWVLREACRQAVAWQALAGRPIVVAVNLSVVQFKRGGLVDSVQEALAESGLDPSCLELELTESILIKDTVNVLAAVKQLKALGLRLSIDDFGTGYSSLAYLRLLDLDKLKIDQSFVRDISENPDNDTIVKAIVQLAKGLGLKTIAEGVETRHTLEVLRRHGCDEVQGYYFARPMPADELSGRLRKGGS